MSVSVVIPALNEQDTVAGVVEACLQSCADEVLVVDPDSTDATAERAARIGSFDGAMPSGSTVNHSG